jgi:hypothetical protein
MNCKGSLKVMHPSLLRRETVLGAGSLRSAKATKSDAGMKLGVPTSSRTSLSARIEIAVPLGLEVPALLGTPHPRLILPAPPCSLGWSPHALEESLARVHRIDRDVRRSERAPSFRLGYPLFWRDPTYVKACLNPYRVRISACLLNVTTQALDSLAHPLV